MNTPVRPTPALDMYEDRCGLKNANNDQDYSLAMYENSIIWILLSA